MKSKLQGYYKICRIVKHKIDWNKNSRLRHFYFLRSRFIRRVKKIPVKKERRLLITRRIKGQLQKRWELRYSYSKRWKDVTRHLILKLRDRKWTITRRSFLPLKNRLSLNKRNVLLKNFLVKKKVIKNYYQIQTNNKLKQLYIKHWCSARDFNFQNMLRLLELRVDMCLYRTKMLPTLYSCKEFIKCFGVQYNLQWSFAPSLVLKAGDVLHFPKISWILFFSRLDKRLKSRFSGVFLSKYRRYKSFVNIYGYVKMLVWKPLFKLWNNIISWKKQFIFFVQVFKNIIEKIKCLDNNLRISKSLNVVSKTLLKLFFRITFFLYNLFLTLNLSKLTTNSLNINEIPWNKLYKLQSFFFFFKLWFLKINFYIYQYIFKLKSTLKFIVLCRIVKQSSISSEKKTQCLHIIGTNYKNGLNFFDGVVLKNFYRKKVLDLSTSFRHNSLTNPNVLNKNSIQDMIKKRQAKRKWLLTYRRMIKSRWMRFYKSEIKHRRFINDFNRVDKSLYSQKVWKKVHDNLMVSSQFLHSLELYKMRKKILLGNKINNFLSPSKVSSRNVYDVLKSINLVRCVRFFFHPLVDHGLFVLFNSRFFKPKLRYLIYLNKIYILRHLESDSDGVFEVYKNIIPFWKEFAYGFFMLHTSKVRSINGLLWKWRNQTTFYKFRNKKIESAWVRDKHKHLTIFSRYKKRQDFYLRSLINWRLHKFVKESTKVKLFSKFKTTRFRFWKQKLRTRYERSYKRKSSLNKLAYFLKLNKKGLQKRNKNKWFRVNYQHHWYIPSYLEYDFVTLRLGIIRNPVLSDVVYPFGTPWYDIISFYRKQGI